MNVHEIEDLYTEQFHRQIKAMRHMLQDLADEHDRSKMETHIEQLLFSSCALYHLLRAQNVIKRVEETHNNPKYFSSSPNFTR